MFLLINLLVGLAVDLVTWVVNKDEGYANQGLYEAKGGGTFGQGTFGDLDACQFSQNWLFWEALPAAP